MSKKKKDTKEIVFNKIDGMKIEMIPIDQVIPNEYNPNRQSDHDFELLCRSIEEDGFTQPIIVRRDTMRIVDGEHRWRAFKILNHTEIPAILVDFTDEQSMISTLRHNRARGNEDINKAADVLKELSLMNATEHAADSLLMDEVEMAIMLQDVSNNELNLREEGNQLTVEAVTAQIAQEKQFRAEKHDQETAMSNKDQQIYTLQMVYVWEEAQIVKAVLDCFSKVKADAVGMLIDWSLTQNELQT